MSKTIDELKALANQVKNATVPGENTAERIGGLFVDIIDYIAGEEPEPGPTPIPDKIIYYGFSTINDGEHINLADMASIEKGDSNKIEITPHNYNNGDSLYILVPSNMNIVGVKYSGFGFPMKDAVPTSIVTGKNYKYYESAEESGYEIGNYELEVTINE
jgi:hypothetical protein